ncbi:MAG: PDZ domain-containing protein, partial [Acidobacteria bacterium]|nr:PDZ domain-containing protein [Acidobacteriota bacterium]
MARLSTSRLISATILSLLIVGLFGFRVSEAERSASKTIGIYLADSFRAPFEISGVMSGSPAERAGLEVGDIVVSADGIELLELTDFDRVSDRFVPGVAVSYEILRDGTSQTISLTPGVPVQLWYFPLDGFVLMASLLLFILTWSRPTPDLRSNLLSAIFALIALSMSLPYETVRTSVGGITYGSYHLVDALEMAVAIHLVMLIPRRPSWLEKYPSIVPLNYLLFLVIGLGAAAVEIGYSYFDVAAFPWPFEHAAEIQWHLGGPVWCFALILILHHGIRASRNRIERLQTQLVLVGLLPLILVVMGLWVMVLAEMPIPEKFVQISGLFMLPFLVSIGVAMFRYELIDMELVIERSLLYSMLTSSIFLIFYASLGVGGAIATNLFGGETNPIWIASVTALVLGLMINPLRRSLQDLIDRKIFPERKQQRHRLYRGGDRLANAGLHTVAHRANVPRRGRPRSTSPGAPTAARPNARSSAASSA